MESSGGVQESDLFLQWGNRKRNRCARTSKENNPSDTRRASATRFFTREEKSARSGARKASSSSPENHYTTRGSVLNGAVEESKKKVTGNSNGGESIKGVVGGGGGGGGYVWPKLFLGLSNKEKEEDFMAMKGCKPAHRPKKRPKGIQRSVLLVCPGGWLADMCQDRYQVREMKSSKKRPRGLKAMGSLESDSE